MNKRIVWIDAARGLAMYIASRYFVIVTYLIISRYTKIQT